MNGASLLFDKASRRRRNGVPHKIAESRFRVSCIGGRRSPYQPVCVGTVTETEFGSRVRAEVQPARGSIILAIVCIIWVTGVSYSVRAWMAVPLGLAVYAGMFVFGYGLVAPMREGLLELLRHEATGTDRPT